MYILNTYITFKLMINNITPYINIQYVHIFTLVHKLTLSLTRRMKKIGWHLKETRILKRFNGSTSFTNSTFILITRGHHVPTPSWPAASLDLIRNCVHKNLESKKLEFNLFISCSFRFTVSGQAIW